MVLEGHPKALVAHEFDRRSAVSRKERAGKRAEDRRPQRVRDLARACRFGMRRSEVGAVDDGRQAMARQALLGEFDVFVRRPGGTEVRPPNLDRLEAGGSYVGEDRVEMPSESGNGSKMLGHGGSTSSPATQKRVDRVVEDPAVELIADLPRDVAGRGERNSPGKPLVFRLPLHPQPRVTTSFACALPADAMRLDFLGTR